MRRSNLLMGMVVLPSANALSLGNFQQITSSVIPLTCMVAYNGQISVCTANDFNVACTSACQSSLLLTGQAVRAACQQVTAGPNTLLGIVMAGGIIPALCPRTIGNAPVAPAPAPAPAAPPKPPAVTPVPVLSTRPLTTSSTSESVIPTLPIANPLLDPTSKQIIPQRTSTAKPPPPSPTPEASVPIVLPPANTQSSDVPSTTQEPDSNTLRPSPSSPTDAPAPAPTTAPNAAPTNSPGGALGGAVDTSPPPQQSTAIRPPPPQTTTPGAPASESPAANKGSSGKDTGGGSPFDSQRSQGNNLDGSSALCALVVAVWATVVFGR